MPLLVFNPYKNTIFILQSSPKIPIELLPTSDQIKNLVSCINPLPFSLINPPKNLKVKD